MALPAVAADSYMVVFEAKSLEAGEVTDLIEKLGGTVVRNHHEIGVAIVESNHSNFEAYVGSATGVMSIAPNVKREADWSTNGRARMADSIIGVSGPPPTSATASLSTRTTTMETGEEIPDPTLTPFWPFQWNMQIMGLADVYAAGKYGDPSVKVAVLGAGIDYRHPDLDGKVDLDLSRSFVRSDDILLESLFPGAHPVADMGFSTTHIAGQVSCNVTFLSCVAPNVTLVGVKVQDLNEEGTIGDLVSGILYAADVSDVILIPFNYWGPGQSAGGHIFNRGNADDRADIFAVRRAVFTAIRKGALVITDTSTPFFQFGIDVDADDPGDRLLPAQAGALTIGASGSQDVWSNISNYGRTLVDLVAPGGWADPTIVPDPVPFSPFEEFIWGACSSFSQFGRLKDECAFENQPQFLVILGAKEAAGHAAGVAALIDSERGGRMRAGRIKATLMRTAVDIGSPGYDVFTGHGRIDAKAALGLD